MNADPNGLLHILERHGAELHTLLTRLTLCAGIAEDLLQELFLKLRKANGFWNARNRKAYLFRAAIHLAFDWRRARQRLGSLRTEPAGDAKSALEGLMDAEELDGVLNAMQHLSDVNRQVLVLHYLQEQEYADIADQMGKTEHQVRGLCSKGVARLRSLLESAPAKQESEDPEHDASR